MTGGSRERWERLFDRAADHAATTAEIRRALAAHRGEDGGA